MHRTLTWITLADDFEPRYIDGVADKLTALYETAARRHGFEFRFVEAAELVPACVDRPRLWHAGGDLLARRQCVMVSTASWNGQSAGFMQAIYRTVEASDSILLNQALRTGRESLEHDKLAILHRAAALGVPVPPTVVVPFGRYARSALPVVESEIPHGPYLLKPREMGMGFAVLKLDTLEQLTAALDICAGADQGFIVQQYLPNTGDMRTYIVDGQIVTAQLRRPAPGNYLANISQGGSGSAAATAEVEKHCRRIVTDLDASYLCIDWLMTDQGPVLNEWGTAVAGFSGLPEPERTWVADAFFAWAGRLLAGSV